ncbi:virulence factor TspB C-terminal domain-related protein [Moraxella sp. ZY210820]|uniref:virulence factor TspB C-terminal domain-related protein n=1 Tax=unclassified Moraxella TaxID=2685852 RepID=UPI00272FFAF5|nr:virulence factor TspB C-terminal domain-related protein [Moraxella sp. ZY210820]WLF82870.1 hypothetical protein LU301_06140 [Moraxella sp. ZY210820]
MKLSHLFLSVFLFLLVSNANANAFKLGSSGKGDLNIRGVLDGHDSSGSDIYGEAPDAIFKGKSVTSCSNAVSIYNAYYQDFERKRAKGLNLDYTPVPSIVYKGQYYLGDNNTYGIYLECYVDNFIFNSILIKKVRNPDSDWGNCPKGLTGSMLFNESPNKGYSCLGADARSKIDGRFLHGCQVQFNEVLTLKKPIDGNRYQGEYSTTGQTCSSGIPQGSENPKEKEPKQPTPPKDPPKDNPKEPDCPSGHNSGTFNGKLICVPKVPDAPNTPPSDDNSKSDDTKKDENKPNEPKDTTNPPNENNPANPTNNNGSANGGGSSGGGNHSNSGGGANNGSPNGANNGSANGGMSGDNTGSSGTGTDGTGEKDGNGKDDKDGNGILDFLKDLFKDDVNNHIPQDTNLEFPTPNLPKPNTNLSYSAYCPAPLTVPYNFAGVSGTMEFTFEYICRICEFLRPVVIAVSTFLSALIVSGVTTRSNS